VLGFRICAGIESFCNTSIDACQEDEAKEKTTTTTTLLIFYFEDVQK
jgi:hypothetical protein